MCVACGLCAVVLYTACSLLCVVHPDHGSNDPVARKILSKHAGNSGLAPPADQEIVRSFSLVASTFQPVMSYAAVQVLVVLSE